MDTDGGGLNPTLCFTNLCRGKSISFYREGNLYNAYVRTGDVTRELAPVEPAEDSWTTMEVDDGQREQEESEDQPEELRRVLEAETFSNKQCL